ncbi:glutathione S-transferase [Schizophyllum amplum]|uniref:glutathione transferase n=1 Tax=Schizophyllum amplum TaxID=97359 RepID=A0A550CID8_9AGAR|nr:glutathione S-transferase [Auriculariopsis ampla]
MVLKLYGSDLSTTTPMVSLVLHELNLPFEFIKLDLLQGEHKQPEHVAHQPFGCVPYINDSGLILYESRAICRYLCRKYADRGGRALFPVDHLEEYTRVEQGISIEQCTFDPVVRMMFTERVYKPLLGLKGNDQVFDEARAKLDQNLDVYDKILGEQKYMGGETFTLADLFHIPYATRLSQVGCDFMESKPNVARWYKDITSRQSWLANAEGIKAISA